MKTIIFDWGGTLYDSSTRALFPDTKPVLAHLTAAGYTCAIVSLATAGPERIRERLDLIEREQLGAYFARIAFAVANKDALYEETVRELDVPYSDIIIVDDRVIRGIRWGNTHGCTTVWVSKGKFAHELPNADTGEPTFVVKSIGELIAVLKVSGGAPVYMKV